MILCAAMLTACRLLAQKRLTVTPPALDGQARQPGDDAREVHALLALGEGAADDDVFDQAEDRIGDALERAADGDGGQIVAAHDAERALVRAPDGRTHCADITASGIVLCPL